MKLNIGYQNSRDYRKVLQLSEEIVYDFPFNSVTVECPKSAIGGFKKSNGIRYAAPDNTVHSNNDSDDISSELDSTTKTDFNNRHYNNINSEKYLKTSPPSKNQIVKWGYDRVNASIAHKKGHTGEGTHVAIIDSGVDRTHPALRSNIGAGEKFIKSNNSGDPHWIDNLDHGTHCAGIVAANENNGIKGIAPKSTIHSVKILDEFGNGFNSDVARGIEYVSEQGWDIANISFSGSKSPLVEDACKYAYKKGVLLVASAENFGGNNVGYPAKEPEVIAVNAVDHSNSLLEISPTGRDIELVAPGISYSTIPGGYEWKFGTSTATPYVSGIAAVLSAEGMSNVRIRKTLHKSAKNISLQRQEQGFGLAQITKECFNKLSNSNL